MAIVHAHPPAIVIYQTFTCQVPTKDLVLQQRKEVAKSAVLTELVTDPNGQTKN